jgi:hypothetical protein
MGEDHQRVVYQTLQRLMSSYRTKYLADKQRLLREEVEVWSRMLSLRMPKGTSPTTSSVLSPKESETTDFDERKIGAALADESDPVDERREFDRLLREKRKLLDMGSAYLTEFIDSTLRRESKKQTDLTLSYTDQDTLVELEEGEAQMEEKDLDLEEHLRFARFLVRQSVRTSLAELTPEGPLLDALGSPSSELVSTDLRSRSSSDTSAGTASTAVSRATVKSGGGFLGGFFGGGDEESTQIQLIRELAIEQECELIAAQLTLLMYEKFRAIRPTELLSKGWTSKDKDTSAPHVVEFIFFCESISVWVQSEIVAVRPAARVRTIERLVRVGIALQRMHNQYAQLQVYAGLDSPMAQRFKASWAQVRGDASRPELERFMTECQQVMSSSRNFQNIREMLLSLSTPAIPFLGIFLKDFFMVDELLKKSVIGRASPDQTEKLWTIYKQLDGFRQAPYTFEEVPVVKKLVSYVLDHASKVDVSMLSKLATRIAKEESSKAAKASGTVFGIFGSDKKDKKAK